MIALLDGDVIACKAAYRAETRYKVIQYKDKLYDFSTTSQKEAKEILYNEIGDFNVDEINFIERIELEPVAHAYQSAKLMIQTTLDEVKATGYKNYITSNDKSNFRFQVAKTWPYKGNRDPKNKPMYLQQVRQYLKDNWNAQEVFKMEADDKLMIEHHKDIDTSVICTVDKDLRNAAKWFYNLVKREKTELTSKDNKDHFWEQIIRGDTCDHIPGLRHFMKPRKAGPKLVDDLLSPLPPDDKLYEEAVRDFYFTNKIEYGFSNNEEYDKFLLEIGNLLWIRRWEDDEWQIPK